VGKEEMLSMIRHGADAVFASKDSTVSDADIEAILLEGEKRVSCHNNIFVCSLGSLFSLANNQFARTFLVVS
jgi:hypothetical protein